MDLEAFFLRHHRPPEFTIRLREAINLYRDDRERDGIRPRSVKAILSVPKNLDHLAKRVRTHFKLSHDEVRHSFISYHVALHRSVGDASLQAENSESVVRDHYLNLCPREDGEAFLGIGPVGFQAPNQSAGESDHAPSHLRVVAAG